MKSSRTCTPPDVTLVIRQPLYRHLRLMWEFAATLLESDDAAVSAASPLGPGSADILAALFGMWDHSLCYSADATSKVRREIITRIKEGEAEAERATEANSVVRSLSERRMLVIRRVFLLLIAFLISGVGTALIVLCVTPVTKIMRRGLPSTSLAGMSSRIE